MSLRPCVWGITAFMALSFWGGTFVSAQTPTDFTSWKDAKSADSVPDWIGRMLRDFRSITGPPRDELLVHTLSALKEIVADADVVPSTRYNAILAAGQLVSTEPTPGNLPVAYSAALPYLVDVYQEPDFPSYLKYGALLGIVRHTLCGIDHSQQDKIIDLLLGTVTTEVELDDVTPAVWHWFRRTALDGLTALKTVGTNKKVVTELLAVIERKSQELEELCRSPNILTREQWEWTRQTTELASQAAKTLGDLDYRSASHTDAEIMTDVFIKLTKAVCDVERKAATDSEEMGEAFPHSAMLLEHVVVHVKVCLQSVVWGFRSVFLTANRPGESSFYASLKADDLAAKRLDSLLSEIIELAAFLDEGDRTKRSVAAANAPKEFKFDLSELRGALAKCSESLEKILRESSSPPVPRQ